MSRYAPCFDKKYLYKCLLRIVLLIALMKATAGIGFLIVLPLFIYAYSMSREDDMLFWLMISVALLTACPQLVPKSAVFVYSQRMFMTLMGLVMTAQIAGRKSSKYTSPLLGILPYLFLLAITSSQGWAPIVSYLKLTLFILIYFAYIGIANKCLNSRRMNIMRIRSVVLSIVCFYVLGSVALIPFPAYSMMLMTEFQDVRDLPISLFQGITGHSQILGPVVAMLGVMIFADMLFSIKRAHPLYLLLLVCAPVLIFKSASRTGMGAFVACISLVTFVFMRARGMNSKWRGKVVSGMLMMTAAMAISILAIPSGRESAAKFVLKYSKEGEKAVVTREAVLQTRQGKWEEGLENFKRSPAFGNGFQVSEEMKGLQMNMRNILTAPIEKSVWVTAILEEGGIVGFLFFVGFVLSAITAFYKMRAFIGFAMLCTLLLLNMGEFTLFSMSGSGGLYWAFVVLGLTLDASRIRHEHFVQQQLYPLSNGRIL